jgi:hypothetical protein
MQCDVSVAQTLDTIVMGVPMDQLPLDNTESILILVNGEHHRTSHCLSILGWQAVVDDAGEIRDTGGVVRGGTSAQ